MDFLKLKEIAKRLGGILVMEGNEPEFVILSYNKYEEMEGTPAPIEYPMGTAPGSGEENLIDQLNHEISALKEEIRQKEAAGAELI